jgi:hypothetical protein
VRCWQSNIQRRGTRANGIAYSSATKTIYIGANALSKLDSGTQTITPSLLDALDFTIGHEVYHGLDFPTLDSYNNRQTGTVSVELKTEINEGADVTNLLIADANMLMADEANANLQGWNSMISSLGAGAFPNVSSSALASFNSLTGYAAEIINTSGQGITDHRPDPLDPRL